MAGNSGNAGHDFAELVDRKLLDLRQVVVAEYAKLLHKRSCGENGQAASQPSTVIDIESALTDGYSILSSCKQPEFNTVDLAVDSPSKFKDGSQSTLNCDSIGPQISPASATPASEKHLPNESSRKRVFTDMLANLQPTQEFRSERRQELRAIVNIRQRLMIRLKKEPLELVDAIMGAVILANAIAIGVSSDTRSWKAGWLIVDAAFACTFFLESVFKVKMLGLRGYLWGWGRRFLWAWFEVFILVLSVGEIVAQLVFDDKIAFNGVSLFRVIRLIRLTKLLRICRVHMAADLVMMVNGLVGGFRILFWAIVLLSFPLFIFCLVMRETLGEEDGFGFGAQSFNTLPKAGFNTFRCLVVEDCADSTGRPIFVLVADRYGWFYGFLYSLTLVFLKFGLTNVIIAIFVEQTTEAAKHNDIYQRRARLNDQLLFHEKALEMAELAYSLKKGIDLEQVACNLTIQEISCLELSKKEFDDLCKHKEFKDVLAALDVAEEDHLDLFDTLDVDGGGTLDLGEIVSGIGKLRGDARKSDVVAVILLAKHIAANLSDFKDETTAVWQEQQRQLTSIEKFLISNFQICHQRV